MATGHGEVMLDEIINIKCSVCSNKGKTGEAEKYCEQCKYYYCSSCVETHSEFPALSTHILLDKSAGKSIGSPASLPSFPTQRCTLHPRTLDMYCKDHDEVVCAPCIAQSHRSCKYIQCIPEEVALYDKPTFTAKKQKIYTQKKAMEEIKQAIEEKIKELKEALEKEIESVKSFRQEIESLIAKMEQETITKLRTEFNSLEQKFNREKEKAEELIDSLNKKYSSVTTAEGNTAQEFVSMKIAEKIIAKSEEIEKTWRKQSKERIYFKADEKMTSFLQINKQLGTILLYPKNTLYEVVKKTDIDVKLSNDKEVCRILGSCVTEDGSLLLIDETNNNLKRLNMSTLTMKDYIGFKNAPGDVCLVNREEAAVTIPKCKVIQIISLGEKMSFKQSIQMSCQCHGITYHSGNLYVTDEFQQAYMYDIIGQQLRKIKTTSYSGAYGRRIKAIEDRDEVFVCNATKGLIILDNEGQYHSTVTDSSLSHYQDVCTDGRNVFVCGLQSNNIVHFSEDNKLIEQLVKVTKPLSICFDQMCVRLIVTHFNCGRITVFDLQ